LFSMTHTYFQICISIDTPFLVVTEGKAKLGAAVFNSVCDMRPSVIYVDKLHAHVENNRHMKQWPVKRPKSSPPLHRSFRGSQKTSTAKWRHQRSASPSYSHPACTYTIDIQRPVCMRHINSLVCASSHGVETSSS
jgi:hypothetical protein